MTNGKPMGENEAVVRQQQALVQKLEARERDNAYAKKALVGARLTEGLVVDPITGETFKETSLTLNVTAAAGWTLTANTAGAWTTIAMFIVPNGVMFYFRAVKSDVDRNAPYLYGAINSAKVTPIVGGEMKFRVFDSAENELRGTPWSGSTDEINGAAVTPTNWLTRLFFNSRVPVRANAGDVMKFELRSAAVVLWPAGGGDSYITIHAIQLTKQ